MACTWWLSWLAVKRPHSALAGPFLTLLVQMGAETTLPPLLKYLITDTKTACLTDIESWWAGVNNQYEEQCLSPLLIFLTSVAISLLIKQL